MDYERSYNELQRQIGRQPASLSKAGVGKTTVVDKQALILPGDRDPLDVVLRRTHALLQHLKQRQGPTRVSAIEKQLDELEKDGAGPVTGLAKTTAVGTLSRKELFFEASRLNRALVTADARLDSIKRILFVVHGVRGGPVGVKSEKDGEHFCDQYYGHNGRPGGLYILNDPFSQNPTLADVVASSTVANGAWQGQHITGGSFLSPDLSFDAKTIVFSWSSGGTEPWVEQNRYHLFRVNVDGTGLQQLTFGNYDDIHPCWLPSGRIVFCSTRRGGFSRSEARPVPTYTLHSMKADGSDIICLSFHEANEFHPSVDCDGRIVYTRWDHVDRADCIAHHLWTCYPDGRDPRTYHGNYPLPISTFGTGPWHDGRFDRPDAEQGIRPLPGSPGRYIATAAPHHGESFGSLVLIDTRVRDDGKLSQLTRLTPETAFPETEGAATCDSAMKYGTAWPIDSNLYLCNFQRGIYVLDAFGNKTLLYQCDSIRYGVGMVRPVYPVAVRPRPAPPALTTMTYQGERSDSTAPKATMKLMNVMTSDFTWAFDGSVSYLRIIQLIPKTTPNKNTPATGYASESLCRMPLGVVPVDPDGSAYFEAPVGKCIYFQALDNRHMAVQSMRTATYVHPGEGLMCIGCHEDKWATPPVNFPSAWKRPPSQITPEVTDGAVPFNFYRLVKPVFDAKCVACHTGRGKGPDMSYASLSAYVFSLPGDSDAMTLQNVGGSRSMLCESGARASTLLPYLDSAHYDVKLTEDEFRCVTLWLDCNANEFGVYQPSAQDSQRAGEIVWPDLDVDPSNPLGVERKAPVRRFETTAMGMQPSVRSSGRTVVFSGLRHGQYKITIFDMRGMMVHSSLAEGPEHCLRLNTGCGTYLVRLSRGSEAVVKKVVMVR
jgi:hypothetical protein